MINQEAATLRRYLMEPICLKTISNWLTGSSEGNRSFIRGVAIDSRSVRPGDLFFAIRGERVDGHDYLPEVAAKGAVAAVVASDYGKSGVDLLRATPGAQT